MFVIVLQIFVDCSSIWLVIDSILLYGGVTNFPLTIELFKCPWSASRARYQQYLNDQKEITNTNEEQQLKSKPNEEQNNNDQRLPFLDTQETKEFVMKHLTCKKPDKLWIKTSKNALPTSKFLFSINYVLVMSIFLAILSLNPY